MGALAHLPHSDAARWLSSHRAAAAGSAHRKTVSRFACPFNFVVEFVGGMVRAARVQSRKTTGQGDPPVHEQQRRQGRERDGRVPPHSRVEQRIAPLRPAPQDTHAHSVRRRPSQRNTCVNLRPRYSAAPALLQNANRSQASLPPALPQPAATRHHPPPAHLQPQNQKFPAPANQARLRSPVVPAEKPRNAPVRPASGAIASHRCLA